MFPARLCGKGDPPQRTPKSPYAGQRNLELPAFPSEELAESAFAIAQTRKGSFHDSIYLALAISQQATLVTADEKPANATAAYLPVKWLGALQI